MSERPGTQRAKLKDCTRCPGPSPSFSLLDFFPVVVDWVSGLAFFSLLLWTCRPSRRERLVPTEKHNLPDTSPTHPPCIFHRAHPRTNETCYYMSGQNADKEWLHGLCFTSSFPSSPLTLFLEALSSRIRLQAPIDHRLRCPWPVDGGAWKVVMKTWIPFALGS